MFSKKTTPVCSSENRSKLADVVLITDFFRTTAFFLCIIKALSKKYKVAVFLVPSDPSVIKKNDTGQQNFIRACEKLGARIYSDGEHLEATFALVAQRPYLKESYELIKNRIRTDRFIGALTLAWPGMNDEFIKVLNIKNVFVVDRQFLDFLLKFRTSSLYDALELVEVGLPFAKYPLFENLGFDYMIAMPTALSFAHEKDKWSFLESILALYKQIPSSDTIVCKPHNGLSKDGFSSHWYKKLAFVSGWIPGFGLLCKWLARNLPQRKGVPWGKLYTAILYRSVLSRTIDLRSLTSWHHFGIELFYPYVRKGIIGGLSNTQWGALYFRLPFYNCVNAEKVERDREDILYDEKWKGAVDKILLLNMKHFGVEYCRGNLSFDPSQFEIIEEHTRQGDIVEELVSELEKRNE